MSICSSSKRDQCYSALTSLQMNPYFDRCTCDRIDLDATACIDFQRMIFNHACLRKGKDEFCNIESLISERKHFIPNRSAMPESRVQGALLLNRRKNIFNRTLETSIKCYGSYCQIYGKLWGAILLLYAIPPGRTHYVSLI